MNYQSNMAPGLAKHRYVVGFIFYRGFRSSKKVVLIKKTKPEWQNGLLNGVGGRIEDGESAHGAMERECREECGLHIPSKAWINFAIGDFTHCDVNFFYTRLDQGTVRLVKLTDEEPCSIFIVNLRDYNTVSNVQWLIPLAEDCDGSLSGTCSNLSLPIYFTGT